MAWNVQASALKLLTLPGSGLDHPETLADLRVALQQALADAELKDATILDVRITHEADGYACIIFYTRAERPSRGIGFV